MYISGFNLIYKKIFSMFIVGLLLSMSGYSCSSDKSDKVSLNSSICEKKLKEEEARLKKAIEQTKKHDGKGLVTILEVASGSNDENCSFAELSETAGNVLTETLLSDTAFWVKSLAEIDYENMKEFIKNGGLVSINDDKYTKSKKALLINLKKYKGNKKEIILRNLLVEDFEK